MDKSWVEEEVKKFVLHFLVEFEGLRLYFRLFG